MKLYQLYNYIKGSVGINGLVGQLGPESFIEHANTALMYVNSYLGRKRSWQIKTQSITNFDTEANDVYYYRTIFPIVTGTSVKFFCSDKEPIQQTSDCDYVFPCGCFNHIDLSCCNDCCDCCEDKQLEMKYVEPGTPLQPGQFTIMGGYFGGGNLGNKIKARFPCGDCCCKGGTIFISYYGGVRLFNCLNDDIPIPPEYIEAFKLILKGLLSTNLWNGQSNKETLWFTFAKEIIEGLDYNENNIPSEMRGKR